MRLKGLGIVVNYCHRRYWHVNKKTFQRLLRCCSTVSKQRDKDSKTYFVTTPIFYTNAGKYNIRQHNI